MHPFDRAQHRRGSDHPETITFSASLTLPHSLDCPQEWCCFGVMWSSSYRCSTESRLYLTCYSCSKFWLRVRQLGNYTTDRVGCVFTQQFNSIVAEVAKFLTKRPLSRTVLVLKHNRNNPPQPLRLFISHN